MLVDNSIVVIENIYRLRGEGYSIRKAAVEGASQVTGAIIASTLTTICVFAPIIFTEGITRQLFVDIALTIAFTLAASLLVALTFVPMMAAGLLKNTKEIRHNFFDKVKEVYGKILAVCLRFKPIVFIAVIVLLGTSVVAAFSRGYSFMDMNMETNQISATISAKEDETLTFDELTEMADEVVEKAMTIDGIETIGAMAGGSALSMMGSSSTDSISMYMILDEESEVSSADVIEQLDELTKDMDCEVTTDTSASDMTSLMGSGLTINVKGNNLDKLQELAGEVAKVVENTEGTVDVDDGLANTTPSFTISVDKEKAAKYGMTVAQVFQLVYGEMASSTSATTISTDVNDYQVYVQSEEQSDVTLDDIKNLTFTYTDREGNETEVELSDIAQFEEGYTLGTINRDAQTRYISVTAGVDDDHNVSLLSNEIQKELDKIDLPEGYSIEMAGEDEMIADAMNQLYLMLLLAVIFIYLVMVAQFQSLLSPFIIMFTIPLAFTGGLFALYFTGNEVSVVAMIGFVMLAGIIVNNGIVMVDFINQLRRGGMEKKDAIIESGKTRLRPILMTALTTIFAYLIGLPLGVILWATDKDGLHPNKGVNTVLGFIVNFFRSIPAVILMVAMIPAAKLLLGTSTGNGAVIVTLIIAAAPYVARMVESSLKEVPAGVIEAAQAMGCTNFQIIWHVLLPEAKPSLISGCVISTVTILSYTALAATLGGTGLGQIAIIHGHQRSQKLVVWVCVLLIVVIVQLIQIVGTTVVRKTDKRAR